MKRHHVLASIWLITLAALAFALPASAVTVSVEPADTTVTVGDTFTLRVVTDAFPALKGFQTIHAYDPALIGYLSSSPGDVLTLPGQPFSAFVVPDAAAPADSVWYDAALLNGSAQGPGILVVHTFIALAEGDCPVVCEGADFRDPDNAQTIPACLDAMVHIVGPVPAAASSWGRIKTLYR
jgi:hypothetical protein